ncbi:hypothetical protein ANN_00848 [Periplaneta americana]|uniref:Uncharacterized protein n=1 Tax=Periplaneta americana TaxID=6978 RepID=A0ABQ8TV52_PERAM|nr:hypothetical protein ANN_00848 [Periplaneta americana]
MAGENLGKNQPSNETKQRSNPSPSAALDQQANFSENDKSDAGTKASGYLKLLESFEHFAYLNMMTQVFTILDATNIKLQSVNLDFHEGNCLIRNLIKTFQTFRDNYEILWDKTTRRANELDLSESWIPKQRKVFRRLDDRQHMQHEFSDTKEYFRSKFFEFIDCVTAALKDSFQESEILNAVENFVIGKEDDVRIVRNDLAERSNVIKLRMCKLRRCKICNQSTKGTRFDLESAHGPFRRYLSSSSVSLEPLLILALRCAVVDGRGGGVLFLWWELAVYKSLPLKSFALIYINYSNIAARLLRRALKPEFRAEAVRREESYIRFTPWKDGKAQNAEIDVSKQWEAIKMAVTSTVEGTIGICKEKKGNDWFDEVCERATKEKNEAYQRILQRSNTRQVTEEYKNKGE